MSISKLSFVIMAALTITRLAQAGAVSGGGGGTLPAFPVDEQTLVRAVIESRGPIDAFLKGIESLYLLPSGSASAPPHAFDKLFAPGADVFKLLADVKVHLERENPCYDSDGKPVDGSSVTKTPNGICISLPRLKEKLNISNYQAEIVALVLHEISHLLGTTEEEAVEIQKEAFFRFNEMQPSHVGKWNADLKQGLEPIITNSRATYIMLVSGMKVTCDLVNNLSTSYYDQLGKLWDTQTGFHLTHEKDAEYYFQRAIRLMAASDYLCSLPGVGNPGQQAFFGGRYEDGFRSDNEVSAFLYYDRYDREGKARSKSVSARHLDDQEIFLDGPNSCRTRYDDQGYECIASPVVFTAGHQVQRELKSLGERWWSSCVTTTAIFGLSDFVGWKFTSNSANDER